MVWTLDKEVSAGTLITGLGIFRDLKIFWEQGKDKIFSN